MKNILRALNISFFYQINSRIWKYLLRINNVKVGKNFYIEGSIYLKLRAHKSSSKVVFGDNINIYGNIDLRNRESGSIIIHDNVSFDDNVRLVAAQQGLITLKEGCEIGRDTIINAGADVYLDKNVLIGPFCIIQSSNHGTKRKGDIKGQNYTHSPIKIGRGSWLSANVVVLPGRTIGKGVVIGASSVVTSDLESNTINVGIPSKTISYRDQ